jgi:hypothetical protein
MSCLEGWAWISSQVLYLLQEGRYDGSIWVVDLALTLHERGIESTQIKGLFSVQSIPIQSQINQSIHITPCTRKQYEQNREKSSSLSSLSLLLQHATTSYHQHIQLIHILQRPTCIQHKRQKRGEEGIILERKKTKRKNKRWCSCLCMFVVRFVKTGVRGNRRTWIRPP